MLVPVGQQGLPGPPQAPVLHEPALQVPGRGMHEAPSATHRLEAQQPLFWQVLPEQQICPGAPHAVPATMVPPDPPLPAPPEPDPPLPVPPEPDPPLPVLPPVPTIPPLPAPPAALPPVSLPASPPLPTVEVSPPVPPGGGEVVDPLQP